MSFSVSDPEYPELPLQIIFGFMFSIPMLTLKDFLALFCKNAA